MEVEDLKIKEKVAYEIREHPPTTAGGVVGALTGVLATGAQWGAASFLADLSIPPEVASSVMALALAVGAGLGAYIGRIAERYTFPYPWHGTDVEDEREDGEIDDPELV